MNRLLLGCLLFVSTFVQAQHTITGKVVDANTGSPLSGATIRCPGAAAVTVTNADGVFKISVSSTCKQLQASYIGYNLNTVTIADSTRSVTIFLEAGTKTYESLVVVSNAKPKAPRIRGAAPVRGKTAPPAGNKQFAYDSLPLKTVIHDNRYKPIEENPLISNTCQFVSTFAADVDKASYSHLRRTIKSGARIHPDAAKVEELINYFNYDYPQPSGKAPYSIHTELTACPWNSSHQLMRVALQGRRHQLQSEWPSNYVFLIDVSGSMQGPDRLDLVRQSFRLLLDSLQPQDLISIVTYAGKSGLVLEATPAGDTAAIFKALNKMEAGGSTAGGEGIQLAYETARNHFVEGGNNRVILATDGDFNVGVTSYEALQHLIETEKAGGIFLTCLGFGNGNYKDETMELLAGKGNGNYYYIDELAEAQRVLQKDFRGTINTIAKDVKIQVEFNSRFVQGYRLIGYENRLLKKEDFDNDAKDAGEIGEGHTVTALYEIVPAGIEDTMMTKTSDSSRCDNGLFAAESPHLAAVRTRYKQPDGGKSQRLDFFVLNSPVAFEAASANTRWAAAVAMWGMVLRHSAFKGTANAAAVLKTAAGAMQPGDGLRQEFLQLVRKCEGLNR